MKKIKELFSKLINAVKALQDTKIKLKEISDQLTEACWLPEGFKVAALIENKRLLGWTLVEYNKETDEIKPTKRFENRTFSNINDIINHMHTLACNKPIRDANGILMPPPTRLERAKLLASEIRKVADEWSITCQGNTWCGRAINPPTFDEAQGTPENINNPQK